MAADLVVSVEVSAGVPVADELIRDYFMEFMREHGVPESDPPTDGEIVRMLRRSPYIPSIT